MSIEPGEMPEGLAREVERLVDQFAAGRYDQLFGEGHFPLSDFDVVREIAESYPAKFVPLPVGWERHAHLYFNADDDDELLLDVDLWELSGPTDLSLKLAARRDGSKFNVQLYDVLVM